VKIRAICLGVLAALLLAGTVVNAQAPQETGIISATVEFVRSEREEVFIGQPVFTQELELTLTSGPHRGEVVLIEHTAQQLTGLERLSPGDLVYVRTVETATGGLTYELVTRSRWLALLALGLVFLAIVIGVGRVRGLASLLGLAFSFLVIFALLLPRLEAGRDPFWAALGASALTMPVSYVLSHGPNAKTLVALVGSLIGMAVTGLLALGSVSLVQLTGYAAEETGFLQVAGGGEWNIRSLLLAGMMIGVLGVLDDITIAQAGTALQIQRANSTLTWSEVYTRTMQVGQDHIASMVNTLALVYAGASLPLLILLREAAAPLGYLLSQEIIAEEAVRMLVTSCGLIAAVPVTTALAAAVFTWRQAQPEEPAIDA
jgi:uncharacterized membrane protein